MAGAQSYVCHDMDVPEESWRARRQVDLFPARGRHQADATTVVTKLLDIEAFGLPQP